MLQRGRKDSHPHAGPAGAWVGGWVADGCHPYRRCCQCHLGHPRCSCLETPLDPQPPYLEITCGEWDGTMAITCDEWDGTMAIYIAYYY